MQDPSGTPRRIAIVGNSGAGKSALARRLAEHHRLPVLELDAVVWEQSSIVAERPREAVLAEVDWFITAHEGWIVEGCYGDVIERTLARCTTLVFLNPGIDVCLANNRRRPWEPHKHDTAAAQAAMLEDLLRWSAAYYTRHDAWSLSRHRRLFDAHTGPKIEITDLADLDDALLSTL
ncbi:MAG: shikimate kinase [Vicinamibacterales bacterium]